MSNKEAIELADVSKIDEKLTFEEAKLFVSKQTEKVKKEVLAILKAYENGEEAIFCSKDLEEIKDFIENDFLSENDVSEYCQKEIIEDVQFLRGDACNDLVYEIETMYDYD